MANTCPKEPYRVYRQRERAGLWRELRKRRVFPFLGLYVAFGFLVVEGIDQATGHGLLPEITYGIALVFYLFGIPGTAILAWYHGEKGPQKPTLTEAWMHSFMLVGALGVCYGLINSDNTSTAVASGTNLSPLRVAVLYFEDHSLNGELGYLADGLTEELIDLLSQSRMLDVISRNGVAPFRGPIIPRDSVARALRAGSLVVGSVEKQDEWVRVVAQLVDGSSGADVRGWNFVAPLRNLKSIEDFFAVEVALFLRERLGEVVRVDHRRATSSSPEGWTLVQRAERFRKDAEERLGEDDYVAAHAAFAAADSALALAESEDPGWVEPIVLRGAIAHRQARLAGGLGEFGLWTRIGRAHAERALRLHPNHARALELRGALGFSSWLFQTPADPAAADRLLESARSDLEAATRLDPSLASAHSWLGHLYYQVGDIAAAVLSASRAFEVDAYLDQTEQAQFQLSSRHYGLEQAAGVERWCREGASGTPRDYLTAVCQLRLMTTPVVRPDVDLALELVASLRTLAPEEGRAYSQLKAQVILGGILARAGLPDSARSVLARSRSAVHPVIDPSGELRTVEAYMHTLLGDHEEAAALVMPG